MDQASSPVVEKFRKLLDADSVSEQKIHSFLEENTELLHLPVIHNHGLHFDCVFSKFRLSTALTCDFLYLTKTSAFWDLVLIELERPSKRVFRKAGRIPAHHAEFTSAMAQIDSWRSFMEEGKEELLRRLKPFRVPLQENRVFVKYVLVYGRRSEALGTQAKTVSFGKLTSGDFTVLTYDSLMSAYRPGRPDKKNILVERGGRYFMKYLHEEPQSIFNYMFPEHLSLKPAQVQWLKERDYDMDSWYKGEPLSLNSKRTSRDMGREFGRWSQKKYPTDK